MSKCPARGNGPGVQVVQVVDVLGGQQVGAYLVQVRGLGRGFEQDPPGIAQQFGGGLEHQGDDDQRGDGVGQDDAEQVTQRVREPLVGQLITGPAAIRHRQYQAAAAQARQVIRHRLPRDSDQVGQVSRIRRSLPQGQQDPRPRRVRQRVPEPGQHMPVGRHHHSAQRYSQT